MATTMLWRLKVAAGREAEFEGLTSQLVRDVHANEPSQTFEYRRLADDPRTYILFLSFTDDEAYKRYSSADYHRGASGKIMACLDGSPVGEPLVTF
jgi:quinol monooxygenase YgiN